MKSDAKFNLIATRILGQYITFRAKKTAANKLLGSEQVMEICQEIWGQIESFVGPNYAQIIMVLLKTTPDIYSLDVILYHLFNKTHELIIRQQKQPQTLPQVIVIILAVLFYKHWYEMFTTKKDRRVHENKAWLSLKTNFGVLPDDVASELMVFVRSVDDRFHHAFLGKWKIWYEF